MAVTRVDIGFVSADRSLVDFFAHVLELDELKPIPGPTRTVYRLQLPDAVLKVMVPTDTPLRREVIDPVYAVGGLRYLTIWVDDVDAVVARAVAHGAVVTVQPFQWRPTVRIAAFADPDGNTIEVVNQVNEAVQATS